MSSKAPPAAKKRRGRKRFAGLLLVFASIYLWSVYVDWQLAQRDPADAYSSCFKIWATRGLVVDRPRNDSRAGNSLLSIRRAFANGAQGSEIDLYYDVTLQRFVVSHDLPYNQHAGQLLFLEDVFKGLGANKYFWLDLKKLGKLNDNQVRTAASRLQSISRASDMRDRIYVEGEDPFNLGVFRDAGFKTIYDTHPLSERYPLTRLIVGFYKLVFYYGNFTVMGMPAGDAGNPIYGRTAQKVLGHVPVFIYHAPNDEKTLRRLLQEPQVRVIIMGDHSLNLFQNSACNRAKGTT